VNVPRGFDRTLSDWLAAENAPEIPERVYEAALADVRTTGQSRPMAGALTRWLRPRDTLPGPHPRGSAARSPVSLAMPLLLVIALLILAMATALLFVGASRLWPERLFSSERFQAVGSIADPGAAVPGTLTSLPDGRALLTNGINLDLFDPATGQFVRSEGRLSVPRLGETATLLRDGRVLIVGGGAADRAASSPGGSQAEIFDPATGTVTQLEPTLEPHINGSATLLADGRVLIAGAPSSPQSSVPAEVYDPSTQSFSRTGSTSRAWPFNQAVLLNDGRVLIAGRGLVADRFVGDKIWWAMPTSDQMLSGLDGSAEVFDPATDRFSATGRMAIIQQNATATTLADGQVLLVGGSEWDPVRQVATITDAVQMYDPRTGSFTLAGGLPTPRILHAAVLLDDGDVLVMGGTTVSTPGDDTPIPLSEALLWEHETGEFVPAGSMTHRRAFFLATRLQDGSVLAIGNYPWLPGEESLPVPDEEELQTIWSAEVFR
jgi:hypothetical protein